MSPTLAVIGDVHASWRKLRRVLARIEAEEVDGILLVGNLGSPVLGRLATTTFERKKRYLASVESLMRRVEELGLPYLWVPGNHDLPDLDFPGNVDNRVAEIAGLRVAGLGGAVPPNFGFFYEWSDDELRYARDQPDCDILLCHCPPARTAIDWVPGARVHAGSEVVREWAESHHGVLVCGHIHESPGIVQLGDCACLNVGGLGRPHGRAQVGFVRGLEEVWHEDLDSGAVLRWVREAA